MLFYVKRGGQLHGEEIWSIVWFSGSFCSTLTTVSYLIYGKGSGFIQSFIWSFIGKEFHIFSIQRKEEFFILSCNIYRDIVGPYVVVHRLAYRDVAGAC